MMTNDAWKKRRGKNRARRFNRGTHDLDRRYIHSQETFRSTSPHLAPGKKHRDEEVAE